MVASVPFDGLALLISAITETVLPERKIVSASNALDRANAIFSSWASGIDSDRLAASSREPAYKDSSNYFFDLDPPTP